MKLSAWEPDLRSLVTRIDNQEIDLQPDFQRLEVWTTAKKKRLIDTVLREWSIPPVHLVVLTDGRMVVLDGQQRLASIRDFLHNRFQIDGRIAPHDYTIAALHGQFYSELDQPTRRLIDNYTIRAFRITEYSPEEPNELFYRLNQPTALTAGEQRNALFGAARDQLKELVTIFEEHGNSRETIGFSNSRMSYDDVIAKLLYFCEIGTIGIKSSEGVISDRFKTPTAFGFETYDKCRNSVVQFSNARKFFGSQKFNKATLLSWLLFYARFNSIRHPEFLHEFSSLSGRERSRYRPNELKYIFDDRASLRVSDVSSVVTRDFCLWAAYTCFDFGDTPEKIKTNIIGDVFEAADSMREEPLAAVIADRLDVEAWGATL